MRRHLLRFCLLLFPLSFLSLPAYGSTIKNFVIVDSSTGALSGGQFNGGGTYSGTFSLDTSNLDTSGNNVPLTSYDITTTGPAQVHFSPNFLGDSGFYYFQGAPSIPLNGSLSIFTLEFFGPSEMSAPVGLALQMIEPSDTFSGGLVLGASEFEVTGINSTSQIAADTSGSASILDPAALSVFATTPLPPALPLFVTGLSLLGLLGWWMQRKAIVLAGLYS